MIAKGIVILAVIAHISAFGCECGHWALVTPNVFSSQMSPDVLISSANTVHDCSSSNAVTRNIVTKGKYPVTLRNCGPVLDQRIPVTTFRVIAPLHEKPTIRLPASIPVPKTICHSCTCYKTIFRPRVRQQIITVPSVERFLETSHKPVIENIQYEALPINCGDSRVQLVQIGGGASNSGLVELISVGPQIQTVEIPSIKTFQLPLTQVLEAQRNNFQIPQIQTVPLGSCSCQC